jgi:hypothetical protein
VGFPVGCLVGCRLGLFVGCPEVVDDVAGPTGAESETVALGADG